MASKPLFYRQFFGHLPDKTAIKPGREYSTTLGSRTARMSVSWNYKYECSAKSKRFERQLDTVISSSINLPLPCQLQSTCGLISGLNSRSQWALHHLIWRCLSRPELWSAAAKSGANPPLPPLSNIPQTATFSWRIDLTSLINTSSLHRLGTHTSPHLSHKPPATLIISDSIFKNVRFEECIHSVFPWYWSPQHRWPSPRHNKVPPENQRRHHSHSSKLCSKVSC